jgi:hypothetical protein
MAEFKVGQEVKFKDMAEPATILSGPHSAYGTDRWLIRKADGNVTLARENGLSGIADRREIVAEAIMTKLASPGNTWGTLNTYAKRKYREAADAAIRAVDESAKPEPRPLAAGDRIRILRSGLDCSSVTKGDEFIVVRVFLTSFKVPAPYGHWTFRLAGEGTGWERAA